MKRLWLVLLLSPVANAKILNGSAICASEKSVDYSLQFAWDDDGHLTSATLYKQSRGLFDFVTERDTLAFVIAPDRAALELRSPSGESLKLKASIDDHGVGQGALDWRIPSESFEETDATLMCSF